MRIIKEGTVKLFQITCQECNCIFEFTQSELAEDEHFKFIICPCCNHKIKWFHNENIK